MFNHDMDIINMLNKDTVYLHSQDIRYYSERFIWLLSCILQFSKRNFKLWIQPILLNENGTQLIPISSDMCIQSVVLLDSSSFQG